MSARPARAPLPASFWALWTGLLVNRAATFVVAFLGLYLVRDRGFSPAAAGQVLALYGLGSTLAGPLGGVLADRFGRKVTMLTGLLASAAAVGSLAAARAPALVGALAFLAALLGETYRPASHAAVADLVPEGERRRAFGLVYWAVNLGMAIGLVGAGFVAERSRLALFVADAVTSVACAVLVFALVPESRPPGGAHEPALAGLARVARDRHYMAFLALFLGALVIFCQWQLALPLDLAAHGHGPRVFSWLMALNCGAVVVLQPLLAARVRAAEPGAMLALSAVLTGLGYGVNALGGTLAIYVTGTLLWTVAEVVGFPTASALAAELAPPDLRGRYQGAYSMVWGAALLVSPLAAGAILAHVGARPLWVGCVVLGVVLAAGQLALAAPRRRHLAALRAGAGAADGPVISGAPSGR